VSNETEELERLRAENAELRAALRLLERDLSILGPENLRLSNAYAAALAEVARLKAPRPKGKRGRPRKAGIGTYEEYLVREALEEVVRSARLGKRISEKKAAVIADKRIRETAANLQEAVIPGAFAGIASAYPASEDSIYNAFRRGKRAMGFARRRTNK
jgi:hypothetical protein